MGQHDCPQCGFYHRKHCPSPAEIAAKTAEIRKRWASPEYVNHEWGKRSGRPTMAENVFMPQVVRTFGLTIDED